MRALGYVRVSKADRGKSDEDQRQSLRAQCRAIARYCEDQGWDLLECIEDFDITGSHQERDGYQDLLARFDLGEADRLVVVRLDRLSREAHVLLSLLDRLPVVATEQAIDASTAGGWLAAGMQCILAEHERRLISERTKAVMAQRKREGKVVGRTSKIAPNVHDRIVALSETMSASAIARLFNEEQVPKWKGASDRWDHSHITAALRRAEALA